MIQQKYDKLISLSRPEGVRRYQAGLLSSIGFFAFMGWSLMFVFEPNSLLLLRHSLYAVMYFCAGGLLFIL